MEFYAKSMPKIEIAEHTKMVEDKFKDLLDLKNEYFSEEEIKMIKMACHYHDIGKINQVFQDRINNKKTKKQIPHGYLSILLINWKDYKEQIKNREMFKVVLNAIYYHHRRDDFKDIEIKDYSMKYLQKNANIYFKKEVKLQTTNLIDIYNHEFNHNMDIKFWYQYALVKGILNKCDWNASGNLPVEFKPEQSICNNIIKEFDSLKPLQEFMKNNSDKNIIVIGSTGSGKTEGALLWLNEEKGFFTLPMKVSANSIYDRIKKKYLKNVAILHSDCYQFYEENRNYQENEDDTLNYQFAKNLSYPLTVCTIDQIFKFAYKSLGTEHLLATMHYSKVIIDELQSYSPELLATIVYSLNLIHQIGGKFAIITATLPKFVLNDLKNCNIKFETFMNDNLNRHKIKVINKDLIEDIEYIKEAGKYQKVLVICNTVAKAQNVYNLLADSTVNVYLLHARFIKKHRNLLEEQIINFARGDNPGICISTQIVEASLDIDFDILYTYLSSIDSLIQRMGRVFRNRENIQKKTNVYVYTEKNGIGRVYDKEIFARTLRYLDEYNEKIFTEEDKINCMDQVYEKDEIKNTKYFQAYTNKLKNLENIHPLTCSLEYSNDKFRNIHSVKLIPDIIYERYNLEELIDQIKENTLKKDNVKKFKLLQELDEYCINYVIYRSLKEYKWFDHISLIDGMNIYKTKVLYDFDELKLLGNGLLIDKKQDEEEQYI